MFGSDPHLQIYIYISVKMLKCKCIHMYIHISVYLPILYVYLYTYIHTYMYVYIQISMYTYIYIYMYMHICVYQDTHVNICVCYISVYTPPFFPPHWMLYVVYCIYIIMSNIFLKNYVMHHNICYIIEHGVVYKIGICQTTACTCGLLVRCAMCLDILRYTYLCIHPRTCVLMYVYI